MDRAEFLALARLDAEILETWMAAGWIMPDDPAGAPRFSAIDLARAQLIHDLKGNVGVNDAGIDVALHLMDQLHGLRRKVEACLAAMRAQPDELRERLASDLHQAMTRDFSAGPRSNARD